MVNNQEGSSRINKKIDHALVSQNWIFLLPQALVTHLTVEVYDHHSILLSLAGEEQRFRMPFRYFEAWSSDHTNYHLVGKN